MAKFFDKYEAGRAAFFAHYEGATPDWRGLSDLGKLAWTRAAMAARNFVGGQEYPPGHAAIGDQHVIIEAADCIGVRGADWALTIQWPDGTETIEHVSTQAAKLLGFDPEQAGG